MSKSFHNREFSFVELIVVLAIIAILVLVVVHSFSGYKERTKKEVSRVNCLQLKRIYNVYLILEYVEHSEAMFTEYLQKYGVNICPDHGYISYVDGNVWCSVHSKDDEVSYL